MENKVRVIKSQRLIPIANKADEEKKPLWNSMMKYLQSVSDITDLSAYYVSTEPLQTHLLAHRMLALPWRNFVIKAIKYPLIKAVIRAGKLLNWRFGKITKENTAFRNTHCLLNHKVKFLSFENNKDRVPLFGAAFDILIAENEHDPYYRYRLDVEIEFIIKDILAGKWLPRPEGTPFRDSKEEWRWNWKEPAPYGGKYSIVYKLQKHRKEILKLLEEDVQVSELDTTG